jgi:hypothetical protein
MNNRRIFVEKKEQFRVEAASLLAEFNENLSLSLGSLRLINVYDLFGFSDDLLEKSRYSVFGEVVTDTVTDGLPLEGKKYIAVEYIPGQFDQRASSAVDCVHLIDPEAEIEIKSSRLVVFEDSVSEETLAKIRHYFINPVECREKDLSVLSLSEKAAVKPSRTSPASSTSLRSVRRFLQGTRPGHERRRPRGGGEVFQGRRTESFRDGTPHPGHLLERPLPSHHLHLRPGRDHGR